MHLLIKISFIFILGLSLLTPNLASSHENHGVPLNDEQAVEKAVEYTGMIIEKPETLDGVTLDDSWETVTDTKIYKKDLRFFTVSLYNPSQEKTLYILMNTYGELGDANFDGVFEEQ